MAEKHTVYDLSAYSPRDREWSELSAHLRSGYHDDGGYESLAAMRRAHKEHHKKAEGKK